MKLGHVAIDGTKVPSVTVSLSLRVEGVRRGSDPQEEPALVDNDVLAEERAAVRAIWERLMGEQ